MNQAFYDQWKTNYLLNAQCGWDRYYVSFIAPDGTISASETHGYGMMILALMAGYDPHAQWYFDGMYRMFLDHPSVNSAYLMGYDQVQGCGPLKDSNGNVTGNHDATDGDEMVAYALLLADKQWGSGGTINYLVEAKKVISAIATWDVEPTNNYLYLGSTAGVGSPYYSGTRPSDFMMTQFRAFNTAMSGTLWNNVLNKSYSILSYVQTNYSPTSGLVPDFIAGASTATPTPAPLSNTCMVNGVAQQCYLEGPTDNAFSYNANRVPWRIATDYLMSGEPRAKVFVTNLNTGIQTITGANISNLKPGYTLTGVALIPNWTGAPLAFVAPLTVAAMVGGDQAWMDATYNMMINTPSSGDTYSDCLKMLALLVVSNNWWAP